MARRHIIKKKGVETLTIVPELEKSQSCKKKQASFRVAQKQRVKAVQNTIAQRQKKFHNQIAELKRLAPELDNETGFLSQLLDMDLYSAIL